MPSPFVHLHLHTQYSLLDGAIKQAPLFERAKALGMPAVAQTDHGNLFGSIEFYEKARAGKIANFTGIDSPYEPPEQATIRLHTDRLDPGEAAEAVLAHMRQEGFIED